MFNFENLFNEFDNVVNNIISRFIDVDIKDKNVKLRIENVVD